MRTIRAALFVALTTSATTWTSAFVPVPLRFHVGRTIPTTTTTKAAAAFLLSARRFGGSPALSSTAEAEADADTTSPSGGSDVPPSSIASAKTDLLTLARLSRSTSGKGTGGVFVTDPTKRSDLEGAAARLEAVCGPMTTERERQLLVGEWTLLCTTNSPGAPGGRGGGGGGGRGGMKKKKKKMSGTKRMRGPFELLPESGALRDKIRNSFEVTQKIRTASSSDVEKENDSSGDVGVIDRVDNIIEFTPFTDTLKGLFGEDSPLAALPLNLNPLEVSKTKVTLIHDANVESVSPVLRTKIALKSVVLTVAGTSRYLEPDGSDVLGLNVPLGEFLNAGSFDTTYVDETMRVSRGKIGPANVLRVFARKGINLDPLDDVALDADDVEGGGGGGGEEDTTNDKSDLRNSAERLRDAVGDAVDDAVSTFTDDVNTVREKVEDVRSAVLDIATDVRDVVEDDLTKVRKSVEAVGEAVEDAAENAAVTVTDDLVEVVEAAVGVRDAVRAQAAEVADDAKTNVEKAVEGAVQELGDQAEEGLAAAVGAEDAAKVRGAVDDVVGDVLESAGNVTSAVREAASNVAEAVGDGAGKVRDAAEGAGETVRGGVEDVRKVAEEVAEDVAEAVARSEQAQEEGKGEEEDETASEGEEEDDDEGKGESSEGEDAAADEEKEGEK